MTDIPIAGVLSPTNPDEQGTPEPPRRKRPRNRPGPGVPGSAPAEGEPQPHDGEVDVLV